MVFIFEFVSFSFILIFNKEIVFVFKSKDGNRVLNSHFMIDSQGNFVGQYSKVHLFDVQTDSLVIKESDYTESGLSIVDPIPTPAGRVALGIVNKLFLLSRRSICKYV